MDIALNFINNSNDHRNQQIVIFQKNLADRSRDPEPDRGQESRPGPDPADDRDSQPAVAWKVIRNCGPWENHPFTLPDDMQVSTSNRWGNHTPRLAARHGQKFHAVQTSSGRILRLAEVASVPLEIQVLNAHPAGPIAAEIYRDGRLLGVKSSVAPQQNATFRFGPSLWIGLAPWAVQGQVMSEARVSEIRTELSLFGIAAADIVMTGGGPGPDATAFEFRLENIVTA
jgi:hypothetical protein